MLQHPSGPFSEHPILDYYIRVEFQHRGSPHIHCLIWLSNAPVYRNENGETMNECVCFIDKYITTSNAVSDNLIQLQTHGHSKSCLKFCGDKMTCRFGFPQMPMPLTTILEPLEDSCTCIKHYEDLYKKIKLHLIDLEKRSESGSINLANLSFENFMSQLNIVFDDYVLAI